MVRRLVQLTLLKSCQAHVDSHLSCLGKTDTLATINANFTCLCLINGKIMGYVPNLYRVVGGLAWHTSVG